MEPWQNWAIASVLIGGAAYYYSITSGQKKRPSGFKPYIPKQIQPRNSSGLRNDSKDKKRKEKEASGSDHTTEGLADVSTASAPTEITEPVKKRKGQKKQQPGKIAQSSAVEVLGNQDIGATAENEGIDNLEFAKQLSDKIMGTSLKQPDSTQKQKAKRQAKHAEASAAVANGSVSEANGLNLVHKNSASSSTTGGEADDDLSSANSPELGATTNKIPSGADVSDMLEPPAKGPSVLRLTEPANPQPQRQPKPLKPVQEPETKKQRQNRRKREEQKAEREQAEKERRSTLENQRRTVREAEGRPAKNGLASSQALASNVWLNPAKADGDHTDLRPAEPQNAPLLDTFEDPGFTASTTGKRFNDLPSEEEQMKILSEMESDNAWSTVAKGGKSKKKGRNNQAFTGNGATDTAGERDMGASRGTNDDVVLPKDILEKAVNPQPNEPKVTQHATQAQDSQSKPEKATRETIDHSVWNRSNIHEHPDYDPAFPYALTGHPEDSEWAVV